MNSIHLTKTNFQEKKITKPEFIAEMHESHKVLFDFAKELSKTEISKIEIENNKVVFTTRATNSHPGGARFNVDELDPRITPIEAFNFDMYESQDSEFIFGNLKDGETFFDIGTNIGWYSIHLAMKNANSKIYSFEPIPNTFHQLKENIALNAISNIHLNNLALSNSDKPLEFFYNPNQTGASSSKNITGNEDLIRMECKAMTLDHYCETEGIDKIDFIKCDVEGAELFVFEGALQTIEKLKPIVFTEMLRKWFAVFNYHPNDLIALFAKINYQCFILSAELKLIEITEVTDETTETNYIFLDKKKHESILMKYA